MVAQSIKRLSVDKIRLTTKKKTKTKQKNTKQKKGEEIVFQKYKLKNTFRAQKRLILKENKTLGFDSNPKIENAVSLKIWIKICLKVERDRRIVNNIELNHVRSTYFVARCFPYDRPNSLHIKYIRS